MNKALGMSGPAHALVAINDFKEITADVSEIAKGVVMDFYKIAFNEQSSGLIRYGQGQYDFNSGGLSFFSPHQLMAEHKDDSDCPSTTLLIHLIFFTVTA